MVSFFHLFVSSIFTTAVLCIPTAKWHTNSSSKTRTVVTTDMEQDDLTSLVRYLLYSSDLDTQGLVYSASRFHWEGDYKGTEFFLPDREYDTPQTSFRWTGNTTIQDIVIPAYAAVYDNLRVHDSKFPTPEELLSLVKIGNVDFEGEMDHDTDGSNLIKSLVLDNDPRPLYLQAWGGTNTIARALKSVEEQYNCTSSWPQLKAHVSEKVVIMASGFQDESYADYIALTWPDIQVRSLSVAWTGYNCNSNNTGNIRGLPSVTGLLEDDHVYFTGDWIHQNIEIGSYGRLYRSWLDGQHMPGDQLDVFGNTSAFPIPEDEWCPPLGLYDFLGEGDDGTYFPLLHTGIEDPATPNLGGWGGRAARNTSVEENLWESVTEERAPNGTEISNYGTNRFIAAMQNDFAARIQWTLTADYSKGNHPPTVGIVNGDTISTQASSNVTLTATVSDPDGDMVTTEWWQYIEEGTYNGTVSINALGSSQAVVQIPADANSDETISIILEGTDNGNFPLTRYARCTIVVE